MILYCLGNDDKEKGVHVQYRHSHCRANYVVHNLQLVESMEPEPTEPVGQLCSIDGPIRASGCEKGLAQALTPDLTGAVFFS